MTAADVRVPLVSIVVPVFNGERYLRESLQSILAQTYSRIEVVVMDDASTDATPGIAESFGDRIKYRRQAQTQGIYENANAGIGECQGEFVAVYHADDIYEPTIVQREVAFLQKHREAGAVFCMDTFIDANGDVYDRLDLVQELRGERPLEFAPIFNALLTYRNIFLVCPTAMVRAAVYRQLGRYDQKRWRNTADLEMWLRIARKYPIGILEDQLLRYRHGHGSSSQRYHHLRTDEERYFAIMDHFLEDVDGDLITSRSRAAYQAHRAWDRMRRSINLYILGERNEARDVLKQVRTSHLLASPQVQRFRLAVLLWGLRLVVRLPKSRLIANLFNRRWNTKRIPGPKAPLHS